jgi:hypothetical protein
MEMSNQYTDAAYEAEAEGVIAMTRDEILDELSNSRHRLNMQNVSTLPLEDIQMHLIYTRFNEII